MRLITSIISLVCLAFILSGCARTISSGIKIPDNQDDFYFNFIESDLLSMKGQLEKSNTVLLKMLEKHKDSAYLHYMIAVNLAYDKKFDEAYKYCERSVELASDDPNSRLFLGKLASVLDNHNAAIQTFEALIRDFANNEDYYPFLANEYVAVHDYPKAVATLKKMLVVNPDSVTAYFYLGKLYEEYLQDYSNALKMFKAALVIEPTNIPVHQAIGEFYVKRKQLKLALQKFEEIFHLDQDDVANKLKIAILKNEMKDTEGAIKMFEDIKKNPEADKIRFHVASLYEGLKKNERAVSEFQKIPPSSTYYKESRLHIASLARDLKDFQLSVNTLKEAIDNDPKTPNYYEYLAAIFEEAKKYNEAIEVLELGRKNLPEEEKIAFLLAIISEKLRDREKAVNAMLAVLKINPKNASAMNYIGYAYAEMGERLEEALKYVQQALILRPDDGYITDSLGWVYLKMNELEKAQKYLQKADKIQPNEPTILYHLGELSFIKGDVKAAVKYMEAAIVAASKKKFVDEEEVEEIKERLEEIKQ